MRLFVTQGGKLSASAQARLEARILIGPPRQMFRDDLEPERWESLVNRSAWLHLAKLREGSTQLGEAGSLRFNSLSAANPAWRLARNEQDEFSFWMSGTGDPDYEDSQDVDIAPRNRRAL